MGAIKGLLLMVLVGSAIILAFASIVSDVAEGYNIQNATDIASFNATKRSKEITSDMRQQLNQSVSGTSSYEERTFATLAASFNVFGLIFSSIDVIVALISDFANIAGGLIPSYFIDMLYAAIALIILLAVLSIVFKWDL